MTELILEIFEEQNPDGTYKYADEDVRNFIPALFCLSGKTLQDENLSPSLKNAMMEFAESMNLSAEACPLELAEAVNAALVVRPLHPRLLAKLQAALAA